MRSIRTVAFGWQQLFSHSLQLDSLLCRIKQLPCIITQFSIAWGGVVPPQHFFFLLNFNYTVHWLSNFALCFALLIFFNHNSFCFTDFSLQFQPAANRTKSMTTTEVRSMNIFSCPPLLPEPARIHDVDFVHNYYISIFACQHRSCWANIGHNNGHYISNFTRYHSITLEQSHIFQRRLGQKQASGR